MRTEMVIGFVFLSVYILILRFAFVPQAVTTTLLLLGLAFWVLGILPKKYYKKYEEWKKSFFMK